MIHDRHNAFHEVMAMSPQLFHLLVLRIFIFSKYRVVQIKVPPSGSRISLPYESIICRQKKLVDKLHFPVV